MFGNRGAIHRNERPFAAVAQGMHRPCNQVLARARFAGDQHREVVLGNRPDGFIYALHFGASAYQLLEHVRRMTLMMEPQVFFQQPAAFEGFFQTHHQSIVIEGFGDEIVGAALHGFHSHFDMTVGGHHNEGDFLVVGFDPFEHFETADPWHFNVCQHQVVVAVSNHAKGHFSRRSRVDPAL